MKHPFFFGYGSLVNRATHDYGRIHPARAHGWRRVWRHSPLRPVSFLNVVPETGASIDGLIAEVPDGDWQALDHRERAYTRVAICEAVDHPLAPPPSVAIYTIPDGQHAVPTDDHPILLSYVDVVVQGFLREFGEAGAAAFFSTTHGWDATVLDDRADPIYPRHQRLSAEETGFVDDALRGLSAVMKQRE